MVQKPKRVNQKNWCFRAAECNWFYTVLKLFYANKNHVFEKYFNRTLVNFFRRQLHTAKWNKIFRLFSNELHSLASETFNCGWYIWRDANIICARKYPIIFLEVRSETTSLKKTVDLWVKNRNQAFRIGLRSTNHSTAAFGTMDVMLDFQRWWTVEKAEVHNCEQALLFNRYRFWPLQVVDNL
jgi:hypothetical protein